MKDIDTTVPGSLLCAHHRNREECPYCWHTERMGMTVELEDMARRALRAESELAAEVALADRLARELQDAVLLASLREHNERESINHDAALSAHFESRRARRSKKP